MKLSDFLGKPLDPFKPITYNLGIFAMRVLGLAIIALTGIVIIFSMAGCSEPEIERRHLEYVEIKDNLFEGYIGYVEQVEIVHSGMFGSKLEYLVYIDRPREQDYDVAMQDRDHIVWQNLPLRLWVPEDELVTVKVIGPPGPR